MRKFLPFIFIMAASVALADTFTNRLNLQLPSIGSTEDWGLILNNNFQIIDANAIGGGDMSNPSTATLNMAGFPIINVSTIPTVTIGTITYNSNGTYSALPAASCYQTNIPSVEVAMGKQPTTTGGKGHYDNFDRPNETKLSGDVTPTGDQWINSGPGQQISGITNQMFVSTTLVYASIDNSTGITKISCAFSFVHSTTPAIDDPTAIQGALIADRDQIGLNTMVHLTFAPSKWGLDLYNNGVSVNLLNGSMNLATDGTIYGFTFTIVGTTVTVYPPQGLSQSVSSNTVGSTVYRYGIIENTTNQPGYVLRYNAFAMGNTLSDKLRALGGGLPGNDPGAITINPSIVNAVTVNAGTVTVFNQINVATTSFTGELSGGPNGIQIQATNTSDTAGVGKYWETISSMSTTVTNSSTTTNYLNYLTVNLTAGDWWCSAGVRMDPNGATDTGFQTAISIWPNNTTTDFVAGVNNIVNGYASIAADGGNYTPFIPAYEIKTSGTIPVYFKTRWNYSAGSPLMDSGGIFCHRPR